MFSMQSWGRSAKPVLQQQQGLGSCGCSDLRQGLELCTWHLSSLSGGVQLQGICSMHTGWQAQEVVEEVQACISFIAYASAQARRPEHEMGQTEGAHP